MVKSWKWPKQHEKRFGGEADQPIHRAKPTVKMEVLCRQRHIGHAGGGRQGGVFPLMERLLVWPECIWWQSDLEAEPKWANGTQRHGNYSKHDCVKVGPDDHREAPDCPSIWTSGSDCHEPIKWAASLVELTWFESSGCDHNLRHGLLRVSPMLLKEISFSKFILIWMDFFWVSHLIRNVEISCIAW